MLNICAFVALFKRLATGILLVVVTSAGLDLCVTPWMECPCSHHAMASLS